MRHLTTQQEILTKLLTTILLSPGKAAGPVGTLPFVVFLTVRVLFLTPPTGAEAEVPEALVGPVVRRPPRGARRAERR